MRIKLDHKLQTQNPLSITADTHFISDSHGARGLLHQCELVVLAEAVAHAGGWADEEGFCDGGGEFGPRGARAGGAVVCEGFVVALLVLLGSVGGDVLFDGELDGGFAEGAADAREREVGFLRGGRGQAEDGWVGARELGDGVVEPGGPHDDLHGDGVALERDVGVGAVRGEGVGFVGRQVAGGFNACLGEGDAEGGAVLEVLYGAGAVEEEGRRGEGAGGGLCACGAIAGPCAGYCG